MLSDMVLAQLSKEDLPVSIRRISEAIGLNAALILADKYPGQVLRLPKMARVEIAKRFIEHNLALTDEELSAHLGVSPGFVSAVRKRFDDTAEATIGEFGQKNLVTVAQIVQAVCRQWNVTENELLSQMREQAISFPRHVAMYLTRKMVTNLSLLSIAELFERRDHTTVLYACRMVQDAMFSDATIRQTISDLQTEILSLKRPD